MPSFKYEVIAIEGGCAVFNTEAGGVAFVNGVPAPGLERDARLAAQWLPGHGQDRQSAPRDRSTAVATLI